MNCIKCGREIPEGQMFCRECKLPTVTVPVTPPPAPKKPIKKKKKKSKRKKFDLAKTVRRLHIALTVISILFAGLCAIVGTELSSYLERKEALRQQEANVALRQKEADNRDARIKELEEALQKAEDTIALLQSSPNRGER